MKILHIIPKFPMTANGTVIGGAANSLYNLAKSQSGKNEVNISSFFPSFVPTQSGDNSGLVFSPIRMVSRPNSKQFGLEFIARLWLLAKKYKGKYDVLHGHSGHIDYIFPYTILSKLLNIPLVYSLNCPVSITSRITKFPGREYLITSSAKGVSKFIAISENVSESMRLVGIQKEKVAVIPPAVDIRKFSYIQDTLGFRKKLNLPNDALVFLFVGSIAPTKNLEAALFALRKVVDTLPDAVMIITTELNLTHYKERGAYLFNLVEELQLQKNVIQMGIIDNMQEVMASCDILIAPFRSTDGPSDYFLAALEAMSVGRPVIVSPIGGMKEIVNEEVGIFVAPEDHDQLASAILTLADDKIRRQKMGSHATSLIEEKFDPESISDAVEMVYVEVMQK